MTKVEKAKNAADCAGAYRGEKRESCKHAGSVLRGDLRGTFYRAERRP